MNPKDCKYTKEHEWIRPGSDNKGEMGLADYAQSQLGDIVFAELPEVGTYLKRDGQLATVESTKAAAEVYAPLTGTVAAVNSELSDNPQWLNESPYDKGWMLTLTIEDAAELDDLMDESAYQAFVDQEKK